MAWSIALLALLPLAMFLPYMGLRLLCAFPSGLWGFSKYEASSRDVALGWAFYSAVMAALMLVRKRWLFTLFYVVLCAMLAAGLGSRFMRMGLRCLALALAFAPTGVVAGYVAFPFPASAMLAVWLLAPAQDRHNFAQSTEWGIGSLIVCWLVFMTISIVVAALAEKPRRRADADKQPPSP